MPLPATPWLNTPDWGNIYLGGMGAGSTAAANYLRDLEAQRQVSAQQAIASQQVNARMAEAQMGMQEAQMRDVTQRDLAEKALLQEQHRQAIEDQYREAAQGLDVQKFGLAKEQFGIGKKLDEAKIKQYADMAAATMEYEKRVKAGEDERKVAVELGPRMTGSMSGMSAFLKEKTDPYAEAMMNAYKTVLPKLYENRAVATDKKVQASIEQQIEAITESMRILGGKQSADTVGKWVRGEDGVLRYQPPAAANIGAAMKQWGAGEIGPLTSPAGFPLTLPQAQIPNLFPAGTVPPTAAGAIPTTTTNVPTGRFRAFGPYF